MNEKIESLTTSEIQTLIEKCITMSTILPERNPEGIPNLQLGHATLLQIVEWLIDKKFME